MTEPRRIWWARPRKLCAMERPGGGGRSHRPERRRQEIDWLRTAGVHTVVSIMPTRHNLAAYDDAGMRWLHAPIHGDARAEEDLDALLLVLRRELRRAGAVAVHGNRRTDVVAAACAACLYDVYGIEVEEGIQRALDAGLTVTPEAAALVGADPRLALTAR